MLTGMSSSSTFRLALAAVIAAAALPLSGCLSIAIPDETQVPEETVTPKPTEDADVDEDASGDGISFADGATLPGSTYIEWGDGLFADDGWDLTSPDNGTGGWGYTSADGACTASFWQGTTEGLTLAGDDSTDSDAVLGYVLEAATADVTAVATDTELGYLVGGSGGVDARMVKGEDGDRNWAIVARSFTAVGVGLYVIVDCTGGDFDTALDEVVEKNAINAY